MACVEGAIVVGDKVGDFDFFCVCFVWVTVNQSPSWLNFPAMVSYAYVVGSSRNF